MVDNTPPTGDSPAFASPHQKSRGSLLWWGRVANCVVLGGAALMIADLVWEGIESGKWVWHRFGFPLLFVSMAITNFAVMHRRERKRAELGAAPDPARESGSGNS